MLPLVALDELNDHALNMALALFRRVVTGESPRPMNPAQYNAQMDMVILEWAADHAWRGGA